MAQQAIGRARPGDEFGRLHRLFVEHLGIAVGLAWAASAVAALQAPWLRNIRGLIDPLARPESTASFLFALPLIMALSWIVVAFGGDLLRRSTMLRNLALEFGLAGAVAFAVFCMAIHRVVTAIALAA